MDMKTSVIVLNFNGEQVLDTCLASLADQTRPANEIVVADNGSSDASQEIARRYAIRWVPLGRNHGFARGNNLAVRHADGDLVIFVNNDMRFDSRFVERLISPFEPDCDLFATDARQLNWAGTRQLHGATRLAVGVRPQRGAFVPPLRLIQREVERPTAAVQACAANMAVRRSKFEELGGFDERYAAGWEDSDICWRAWLHGWPTYFVPDAVCYHHVGVASNSTEGRPIRFSGALKGRLVFAAKHLPMPYAMTPWVLAVAGLGRDVIRWRKQTLRLRWPVLHDLLLELPEIIAERRDLYRQHGTSPTEHLRSLRTVGDRTKSDVESSPPDPVGEL